MLSASINNKFISNLILCLFVFMISTGGTFLWHNRSLINQLYYEASLERYGVMTGEIGPVTYLVHHQDFRQLEMITRENEDILGIEIWRNPNIAAMAFTSTDSPLIQKIEKMDIVSRMERRVIPMICH